MSKPKNLGEFEMLVLAALLRLGLKAYGVNVRSEIETRTGRAITVGALYATLSRLEEKGYVTSRMGEATAERGGRAKKYFEISAAGHTQLEKSISSLRSMTKGVMAWTMEAVNFSRPPT